MIHLPGYSLRLKQLLFHRFLALSLSFSPSSDVEWWTAEEYAKWLDEEKEVLQSMIGEKAYTGGDGWFVWTQEKVDETIALYEDNLQKIKMG